MTHDQHAGVNSYAGVSDTSVQICIGIDTHTHQYRERDRMIRLRPTSHINKEKQNHKNHFTHNRKTLKFYFS